MEPDSDALSELPTHTRGGSTGHLSPKDILRYHKGSYQPRLFTLEERTKEAPWGDTWKIRLILVQDKILEVGEDLLTPTESPSQIPTNLKEVYKYAIGSDLTRGYMDKLWSTEDLLVQDKRELLVWHHRLNHCSFKSLLRISKMWIITKELRNIITSPLCRLIIWKVPQEAMEYQRQTLMRVNQESLGDYNQGNYLNLPYGLFPTRYHPPSH